jgi:PAS domain S-box-containing protein
MAVQWTPYSTILLLTAITLAGLAFFVLRLRRRPGTVPFVWLTLAATEWALAYALELGSPDLGNKLFWAKVQYIGIVTLPVAWLIFGLQYTGRARWLKPAYVALLMLVPLVTLALVWTNGSHRLFYVDTELVPIGPRAALAYAYGPAFWVHMAYSYALLALGAYLIVQTTVRSPQLYRGQMIALLVGILVPWLGNAIAVIAAKPVSALDIYVDPTPFAFGFSGLAIAWGLYRFRLLDIVPMAREAVVEAVDDGVIVLDSRDRVVDLNPAGAEILGRPPALAIGQPAMVAFGELPQVLAHCHDVKETRAELSLRNGKAPRYVDLHISPLHDRRNGLIGRVLLLHDVTDRKHAEEILLRRNRELALFNRAGQAFTSTLDLDRVFTTVLDEVRHLLNVAICSVWLADPDTGELVCRQARGPSSEVVRGWRLPPGQGLTGWVYQNERSLMVGDTRQDERHFKEVDERTGWELRSILSVPLRVKERTIGTLEVTDTEADRFTPADLALVESLAATAAIAIENARLYDQARQDAETKAVLLNEVNHRVKNNLIAITGLLYAEQRHAKVDSQEAFHNVMQDLIGRIQGLAMAHTLLSAAEWAPLPLSDLADQVINTSLRALPPEKRVSVDVSPSLVRVTPEQASSLALVISELTTNTIKYALAGRPHARIEVDIAQNGETVGLEYRDDGPGYPPEAIRLQKHGVGLYLVQRLVSLNLHGFVSFGNDQGAVTTLRFGHDVRRAS